MAARTSTKNRILTTGAGIIHRQGFHNTGLQEILSAAGVPKGSFYFYFQSKRDFGLELIAYYEGYLLERLEGHAAREDHPPLERLAGFFAEFRTVFESDACRGGCPVGNLAQEMGDVDEAFRARLEQAFEAIRERLERLLRQAAERGELEPSAEPDELAGFILSSWQGALLQMKVAKSVAPLESFERIIFEQVLARATEGSRAAG